MGKEKLNQILENHKLWIETNGEEGQRADLHRAYLDGANLQGAYLKYANLQHANLQGAYLKDSDLQDSDLQGANLQHANLQSANLQSANLQSADLRGADLRGANLRGADLDYSSFPLWCGGLDVHIDDRQAIQLLYHLTRNVLYSKNTSSKLKKLFSLKSIIDTANMFHRVEECGRIKSWKD